MSRGIRVPGYDTARVSRETATDFTGVESMTQQQFAEEVDINTIMRRFGLTHVLPANLEAGVYGDFSGITDFESAVATVDRARSGFMALPAEIRDKFSNDPGRLIAYAQLLSDEQLDAEFAPRAPGVPAVAVGGSGAPAPGPAAPVVVPPL